MPHPEPEQAPESDRYEAEAQAVLAEFGDAVAAIAALLHDLDVLAADANRSVSQGFVRGRRLGRQPRRR